MTMRQIWTTATGGPEVLQLREAPMPAPSAGEVLVRVEAAGINFADIMARHGLYPDAPPLPAVMGYEIAGVVERAGSADSPFQPGDRVLALTRFGGYSSHVVLPEPQVLRRPDRMSPEMGAALLVNYLTAYQAMIVMGGVRPPADIGRPIRVLVLSAAGGVGTAAADLGAIFGAEMIGAASASKHDYARSRGYAHMVDYRQEGWTEQVRAFTGGQGVDLVLDPIGGGNWKKSFDMLGPGGRIVMFGLSAAVSTGGRTRKTALLREALRIPWRRFFPDSLISDNHGVLGVNVGHLWGYPDEVGRWMQRLVSWYDDERLDPYVDRTFPLEDAAEAHAFIEARKNRGKVVLIP